MIDTKTTGVDVAIESIAVSAYRINTDYPESDGTIKWDSTTLVLVEAEGGGRTGIGYTYADQATAMLIRDTLADVVQARDAMAITGAWVAMVHAVRNLGRPGIASMAISAVDNALWDLKCRLLDLPLCSLLGMARESAPVYGSGGFTSYSLEQLQLQLGGWVASGIPRVKMKVGRQPSEDIERVRFVRDAIGAAAQLFVDANGAYSRKEAMAKAEAFVDVGVTWFEEPVPADDLIGLHLLRDRAPAGMDIAAGEYGYEPVYFRRMLQAEAVDVLQADASRCGGITGFLNAAALCEAHFIPLSAHCAPSLHVHPGCAVPRFRHLEYFHDHVRIERMMFDGALTPVQGTIQPDLTRPGFGLDFKHSDARQFAI
ncbi:MAG: mandelate racemase [Candidatus Eremiobacteraeota bacterium]|nr:mandelate racemase [Candidatus Eremiobacteraeota bacterium]MBC5827300.1 mandelate racemase [Candidatus Eremiobacteraeota bacterium]